MLDTARDLLDGVYSSLDFEGGELVAASTKPDESSAASWTERGDWLAVAKRVGAERVFFVNDNPVIVFAEVISGDRREWVRQFNHVWCMARPQLLFLASDGELSVLNLTTPPVRSGERLDGHGRIMDTVRAVVAVKEQLSRYRREQVESGRLFEEEAFGWDNRADRALMRDLGSLRAALLKAGLSAGHAHALIGRSIFVRYLEDRGVLTEEYFLGVIERGRSHQREEWQGAFSKDQAADAAAGRGREIYYPRVLRNKQFTYALFERLFDDFNGDIFPVDTEEELAVTEDHLALLRRFLLGDLEGDLFFFAYRFDVIPIELISSIYEKFYSTLPERQRNDGSYYTPAALVEFVLAKTLTQDVLATGPRVMDPSCGSGIFLVEAFRRIVRYRSQKPGAKIGATELHEILKTQIRGIDINREAIRVAAFSLYLAMLHYLEPPDILQNKLPSLTYQRRGRRPANALDILLVSDAFTVDANVSTRIARARFGSSSADVIVGNPPWGTSSAQSEAELKSDGGATWCAERSLSIGDKERSQSFIHRSLDLLVPNGRAGLLVSTGVFFKRHAKTRRFREQWLGQATLQTVVNFAAVRQAFFKTEGTKETSSGAIAPFASVVFDKVAPSSETDFTYWSAKETAYVKRVQAVVLGNADVRRVNQIRFMEDDSLWKIYWWGTHRDEALIRRLRLEPSIIDVFDPDDDNLRIGFLQARTNQKPSGWLKNYREFPTAEFRRYGGLPTNRFLRPPAKVKRRCARSIYEGPRLLIKRGVGREGIVARFEDTRFSFRHSIWCIRIGEASVAHAKVALGIIWSSLVKYFLFMTSGTWGLWHDEILKETIALIPMRIPDDESAVSRVVSIVDQLRSLPSGAVEGPLFDSPGAKRKTAEEVRSLERQLDDAVFNLFELAEDDRERVEDLNTYGLDLFYNGFTSEAAKALPDSATVPRVGRSTDVERDGTDTTELSRYLHRFLSIWEPCLVSQAARFRWRVLPRPRGSSLLAVLFEGESLDTPLPAPAHDGEWLDVLERLDLREVFHTPKLYLDGLVRVVLDSDVLIVKRNERRLWTASAAAEDAEATMVLAMARQSGGI